MKSRFWIMCALCVVVTTVHPKRISAQQNANEAQGQGVQQAEQTAQPKPTPEFAQQPPVVQTASTECVPQCRAGYVCRQAQCVSACNPPCGRNETCTKNGECVAEKETQRDTPIAEANAKPEHQHTGLFLRLTGGPGWSYMEAPYGINESGISAFFSFDIGGALIENLILHARLAVSTNYMESKHTIDIDGSLVDTKTQAISYGLLGIGLTYYVMPSNIYLTFVLGFAGAFLQVDQKYFTHYNKGDFKQSPGGLGAGLDFGKEWWVSSEWGLGVAGRFIFSTVAPNKNSSSKDFLKCLGLGVLFTATYN
jgi:hypothetical protein